MTKAGGTANLHRVIAAAWKSAMVISTPIEVQIFTMRMYKVLLREKVKVYGDEFTIELRKFENHNVFFELVNVYPTSEDIRGIPYDRLDEAIEAFEGAVGKKLTDEMKGYLLG